MTSKNRNFKLIWSILALLVLLAFNFFLTGGFFQIQIKEGRLYGSLIDVLDRASPVMLLSLGMTLVIATGGVDLSVGAIMAISGAVAAVLTVSGMPVPFVILVALCASVIGGTLNGILVSYIGIQPIVATLILMVSGRGIAQLFTDGQIITFNSPILNFIGGGSFLGFPFTVTIVSVVFVTMAFLTRKTAFGLFIESTGNNETASRYSGISVRKVKTLAYVISGLCAGIAGIIVASDIRAADSNNAGLYYELDAIFSVIIGGTALTGGRFSLIGSIIGALILQTLTTTILTRGVPVEFTLVIKALVVLFVCLLQSPEFRNKVWRRA